MDIACVNSYIVYSIGNPNKLTLLDFKIVVAKNLNQRHQGRQRAVPSSRPNKRKILSSSYNCDSSHLPEFQQTGKRCVYCASNGKENRTCVTCMACETPLCLVYAIVYSQLLLQKNSEFLCSQKFREFFGSFQYPNLDVKRTFKSKNEIHHQKTCLDSEYQVSPA